MIDYTSELSQLNRDEEFDWFQQQILHQKTGKSFTLGPFRAWTLDEHRKFHEAIKKFDITDTHSISTYIGSRNNEQVEAHLRVYRNHCNKQYPSVTNIPTSISAVPIVTQQHQQPPTTPTTPSTPLTPLTPTSATAAATAATLASSPLITPTSPLTTTSNTFLSNITNNLFKNLIDQLDKEPSINQNMARGKASTTAATSSSSASNKISLHLASHAIPVSMVPPQGNNSTKTTTTTTNTPTTTTTTTTTATGRKNKNSLNTNLVNEAKLKKNQKLLSEPWTEEDQKKLADALVKYPSSRYSSVSRWQVISKELGISPKTVALRYNQMLINLYPKQGETNDEQEDEDDDEPPPPPAGKRKSSAKKAAASTRATKRGKKGQEDSSESSPIDQHDLNSSSGLPPLPIMFSPPSSSSVSSPLTNTSGEPSSSTSLLKREPTIHHLNFDPAKADSLLQRNSLLIDQIRNDIIYTGSTKIDLLNQYKNNINEALKCTMIWSDNSQEMPPLPVKINDMIIGLMGMKTTTSSTSLTNNASETNGVNSLSSSSSSSSSSTSSGKPWGDLPKQASEWFLPIEEEGGEQGGEQGGGEQGGGGSISNTITFSTIPQSLPFSSNIDASGDS